MRRRISQRRAQDAGALRAPFCAGEEGKCPRCDKARPALQLSQRGARLWVWIQVQPRSPTILRTASSVPIISTTAMGSTISALGTKPAMM